MTWKAKVDQTFPIDHIDKEAIQNVKNRFLGSILQIPPIYSAIKKDGKRSYELARQGIDRQLEARPIEIKKSYAR
jgi:tRNA pseudouridine55 synthase